MWARSSPSLLRDPLDRASAHWWHWYSRGVETGSFADLIEANLARLSAGVGFEDRGAETLWVDNLDYRTG